MTAQINISVRVYYNLEILFMWRKVLLDFQIYSIRFESQKANTSLQRVG